MRYLISGGCGFIGSNFSRKLLERGDSVLLADNLSRRGTTENLQQLLSKYDNVEFAHLDIRTDLKKMSELVEQVDVVYHLAGQVAVTTSINNPREDFDINALGTFNVLEAIRNSKSRPMIVFSSTNKVYGGMEEVSIKKIDDRYTYEKLKHGIPESQVLDFHSPYGCSKGAADQYVRDYSRIYGLQTVVMRQSCIYGPYQFGIEDQGWVAWFSIASLLKQPITIYGDGMQVRDVLYVDDLFEAWDAATQNPETSSGKIYNVGGGTQFTLSLLELLAILEEELEIEIAPAFGDWRAGDQPVYISDIRKIKKELGWKPKTKPQAGIQELIHWTKNNTELVKKTLQL